MIRFYTCLLFLVAFISASNAQTIAYHPNSHWHVKSSQTLQPDNRYSFNFFAPQYSLPHRYENGKWTTEEWKQWRDENKFSYAYPLLGHSWQAVVQRNKAVFQKHPEYLSMIKGKRVGYGKTTKLCVSNKELQALFVADRLAAFAEQKNPNGSVSVEPSDGAGFCECAACQRLGSVSNQVFMLANLTAKAVRTTYPNGKVNLYAYYRHAAPPDFNLESNVHVTVVPNGFQELYNGDALLSLWAPKAKHLTYYEYFAIPQQKGEQPRLMMQEYLRRMQLAKDLGYEGFWFETGLNINAAIALQLFNQLWLNKNANWEQVSENFLRSSFAGSYQPMKRLFTRWWHTWKGEEELSLALYDLREASEKAKSADERERINDLKAYVHYLALYQEWNKNRSDAATQQALFDYIANSSNRMVVNAYALYQLFVEKLTPANKERYKIKGKPNWVWVQPLTAAVIEKNFQDDLRRYGSKESRFTFRNMEDEIKIVSKLNKPLDTWQFSSKFSDQVFLYSEKELTLQLLKPKDVATKNDNQLYLTVQDNTGKLITNKFISYSDNKLRITLPKAGIYSLALTQFFITDVKLEGKFVPILRPEQVAALQKKTKSLKQNVKEQNVKNKDTEQSNQYYYYLTR